MGIPIPVRRRLLSEWRPCLEKFISGNGLYCIRVSLKYNLTDLRSLRMFVSDVIFTHSCVVVPDGCELVGA